MMKRMNFSLIITGDDSEFEAPQIGKSQATRDRARRIHSHVMMTLMMIVEGSDRLQCISLQ